MHTIDSILSRLADSGDLQSVLADTNLSAAELLRLLKTEEAGEALRARRRLGKTHTLLLARRYSAYAILRLVELLRDEKPDIRLKGALALLAAAGLDGPARIAALRLAKKRAANAREPLPEIPELDGTATTELLEAVAEVLHHRRQAAEGD